MDLQRQEPKSTWRNKRRVFIVLSILLVVIVFWQFVQGGNAPKVAKSEIWLGTVQVGSLKREVKGFGKLKSKHQRLLTATSGGIVEEILLKPGAVVSSDDIILRLNNPDLIQQVNNERLLLTSENANLRQLRVSNQQQLLELQTRLVELETELGIATFNLEATSKLASEGIVSQLDHKRSQLETLKLQKQLDIEKQRLVQLEQVHQEAINIQHEKINQQQNTLAALETKQKQLSVRAGIDGVLQTLPVELGQNVPAGEILAFVGGTQQLIAEIKVPQNQVEQVQIGQAVIISTRLNNTQGRVTRIDPVVTAGNVLVEVALTGNLPGNARPELSVDALIKAGELTNIVYIQRPVNVQPGSTSTLYRLNANQDKADAVQVTFGTEAGQHIEVTSGASDGDRFILSDTSHWQQSESIILI